jgi:hypothetical protein
MLIECSFLREPTIKLVSLLFLRYFSVWYMAFCCACLIKVSSRFLISSFVLIVFTSGLFAFLSVILMLSGTFIYFCAYSHNCKVCINTKISPREVTHKNGMERKRMDRALARKRTIQQLAAMAKTRVALRQRRMLVLVRTISNGSANKT